MLQMCIWLVAGMPCCIQHCGLVIVLLATIGGVCLCISQSIKRLVCLVPEPNMHQRERWVLLCRSSLLLLFQRSLYLMVPAWHVHRLQTPKHSGLNTMSDIQRLDINCWRLFLNIWACDFTGLLSCSNQPVPYPNLDHNRTHASAAPTALINASLLKGCIVYRTVAYRLNEHLASRQQHRRQQEGPVRPTTTQNHPYKQLTLSVKPHLYRQRVRDLGSRRPNYCTCHSPAAAQHNHQQQQQQHGLLRA